MDAVMGRYKVRIEGTDLILTHELGISFDLTPDETLELFKFINLYRQALIDAKHDTPHDTEPRLERIVLDEDEKQDS